MTFCTQNLRRIDNVRNDWTDDVRPSKIYIFLRPSPIDYSSLRATDEKFIVSLFRGQKCRCESCVCVCVWALTLMNEPNQIKDESINTMANVRRFFGFHFTCLFGGGGEWKIYFVPSEMESLAQFHQATPSSHGYIFAHIFFAPHFPLSSILNASGSTELGSTPFRVENVRYGCVAPTYLCRLTVANIAVGCTPSSTHIGMAKERIQKYRISAKHSPGQHTLSAPS